MSVSPDGWPISVRIRSMKAIAAHPLAAHDPGAFEAVDLPDPTPEARDIVVKVHAVSVNPIDNKMRMTPGRDGQPRVLGWDAAGTVHALGSAATRFSVGDRVFYAGSMMRSGTNAQLHCVDERIVGRMPASLGFADAASLPLTSLTAWEAMFEHLAIGARFFETDPVQTQKTLLILGGAGGVGSIACQLGRQVPDLTVVATASRDASRQWCLQMGAHHVVDHKADLAAQFKEAGLAKPDYVLINTAPEPYFTALSKLIAPFGRMCSIVNATDTLDMMKLRNKAAEFSWQGMFTRSNFQTADMVQQANILDKVSRWVDDGNLRATKSTDFGELSAEHLSDAHVAINDASMIGKAVLHWIAD